MNTTHSWIARLFATAASVALVATIATADDNKPRKRTDRASQMNQSIRVSEMLGTNIQNPRGENVGEVKDIVLDANDGRVRYAAVTYGGFLGLGDKLFAVPWAAFECKANPNDLDERILVLDVTAEQLKGANGFDEDNWPDFANRTFARDLDTLYKVDRRTRDRDLDVDVSRDGVSVELNKEK